MRRFERLPKDMQDKILAVLRSMDEAAVIEALLDRLSNADLVRLMSGEKLNG